MAKRYCEMCDEWVTKTVCPACGMATRKASPLALMEEDRDYWRNRYSKLRDAVGMAPLSDEDR